MNGFICYLHGINKFGRSERQFVNIFKRISDVITDYTRNYDNFDFLINDKFKVTTWMFNNLKPSSISKYSIVLRHAIDSMNIEKNQKKENIRFYLSIATKCKLIYKFSKLQNVPLRKVRKAKKTLNDFYTVLKKNHSFVINFASENFKGMKAIDDFLFQGILQFTEFINQFTFRCYCQIEANVQWNSC